MRPRKVIARAVTLAVATLAILVAAVLAPILYNQRAVDEPFAGAAVMASPRDMHVIAQDVRLAQAPDLVLARGVLYADGNAALGTPISRFVLDGPAFTLAAAATAQAPDLAEPRATPATSADPAPLVEQLATMGFETLTIRRGTLQIATGDGATETLSDIDAEITGRRKGAVTARGSFFYRGQRIKFETTLGQTPDRRAQQHLPIKATLKGAFVDASLEGMLDVARDLQVTGIASVTVPSLRRIARWFSVPVPNADGLNAASIKGQFTWTRRSLAFEQAKISVDSNEGSGTVAVIFSGERPLVDGTLAFNAIDLLPYYEGLRPQTFGFERAPTSWSNLDLSFPLIRYIDTDLRISAPKVTFKGFNLGRTAATLTVRSGKLLADIAELELGTGTASLQISANTSELVPRYALKGKLDNIDTAEVSAAILAGAAWSGKGNVAFDLTGTGQAPIEVLRTLSGRVGVLMAPGSRVPMDIKASRTAVRSAPVSGWPALSKGQTQLEACEVRAVIANGVAEIETPQLKAGSSVLGISGRIGLADGEVDLKLASRAPAAGERPARGSDLLGADAMRLSGAFRNPTLSLVEPREGEAEQAPTKVPN